MTSAFVRLLTFFALLLMPAAMVGAPAIAAATDGHAAASAMEEHCGDSGEPAKGTEKAPVHCVSCTALPAMEAPMTAHLLPSRKRTGPGRAEPFHGIVPDIVTPPPKLG